MKQKSAMSEKLADPITESPASEPLRICSQCGAQLTNEDVFCPQCGQLSDSATSGDADIDIVGEIETKKKTVKFIIIPFVVVMIGALLSTFCFFFNSKAQAIIDELDTGYPQFSQITDDYQSLTPVGQFFFRDKIASTFISYVADNKYATPSHALVDTVALHDYEDCKAFAKMLNITSADDTNVPEYIDAVLALKEYEEYNAVSECVLHSLDSYLECWDYLGQAINASSNWLFRIYTSYAKSSMEEAVRIAESYSVDDALCTEYIDALSTIAASIGDVYSGNIDSIDAIDPAITKADNIISDVMEERDAVENIVDNLPEIELPENETAQ